MTDAPFLPWLFRGLPALPWLVAFVLVLAVVAAAVIDAHRRRRLTARHRDDLARAQQSLFAAQQAVDHLMRDAEPSQPRPQPPERKPFINAGEWSAGRMYVAPDYWRRRVVLSSCSCARCRAEIRKAQAWDALLQRWSPHDTGEATQ